jgi:hypothetical protein
VAYGGYEKAFGKSIGLPLKEWGGAGRQGNENLRSLLALKCMSVVPAILNIDQIGYTLDTPRVGLGKIISDYLDRHVVA